MAGNVWSTVEANMVTQNELRRLYKMSATGVFEDKLLNDIVARFLIMINAFAKGAGDLALRPKYAGYATELQKADTDLGKMFAIDRIINYIHTSGKIAQHFIKSKNKDEVYQFLSELSSIRNTEEYQELLTLLEKGRGSLSLGVGEHTLYGTIPYTGFATLNENAIRDTQARYEAMEIKPDAFTGKTVLDLGCSAGHMLLEAFKFGMPMSFGLEKDEIVVIVGNKIVKYMGFQDTIKLLCVNINNLSRNMLRTHADIEQFDIVFSFAVDRYVSSPSAYYKNLVDITKEVCYFEPNNHKRTWNIDTVKALGFRNVKEVTVPYNVKEGSTRPCFICQK